MSREKKRLKCDELEDHVLMWATDRLDDLRDMAQEAYMNDRYIETEKAYILESLANQIHLLLELIEPLKFDNITLIKWSNEFVEEYMTLEDNQDD